MTSYKDIFTKKIIIYIIIIVIMFSATFYILFTNYLSNKQVSVLLTTEVAVNQDNNTNKNDNNEDTLNKILKNINFISLVNNNVEIKDFKTGNSNPFIKKPEKNE